MNDVTLLIDHEEIEEENDTVPIVYERLKTTTKRNKNTIKEVKRKGMNSKFIESKKLTDNEIKFYTKILKKWITKNKYKKFLVDGFAYAISRTVNNKKYLSKKTIKQKLKLNFGYFLFRFHRIFNNNIYKPNQNEITALKYFFENKLFTQEETFLTTELNTFIDYNLITKS
jgi:hypothetical protein